MHAEFSGTELFIKMKHSLSAGVFRITWHSRGPSHRELARIVKRMRMM